MLAKLLEVPKSPEEWDVWSYHHRISHDAIRDAIMTQKKKNLSDYVIEPLSAEFFDTFLDNNQQLHQDMDSALGAQSSDLQDVDLKNANELEAWIYLHYQEHFTAENTLRI